MLALVLFAAIVLPNLHTKAIAGSAAMGPVPPAPKVGQCLLQDPPDPSEQVRREQPFRLGSCKIAHYGEVAEVVQDAAASVDPSALAKDPCGTQAAYLGWSAPSPAVRGVTWQPITVPVIKMVPVARQQSSGQKWVACVVTPANAGVSYTGSVKNALATGLLPAAFAACQVGVVALDGSVTCDIAHRYEVFATATLAAGETNQQQLDADCRAIVVRATGRADPTAAGALTVKTYPFHRDSTGSSQAGFADPESNPGSESVCAVGVSGPQRLKGSLYGIGEKALPWA